MAIELTDVNYMIRSGFFLRSKNIIENLNFSVPQGTSMGLIGPNGAGKTTTIKLCAGIIEPGSGKVMLNGISAHKSESRKKMGLVTENQYIPAYLTVKEWLTLLGGVSGLSRDEIKTSTSRLFQLFELEGLSDKRIHTLSKGQTQRVGFVQAMLHDPKILILDEPMSGMDPVWRSRLCEILVSFRNNGGTLLFSSHIMTDILRLSDSIMVIESGKIKWKGTMGEICESDIQYQLLFKTSDISTITRKIAGSQLEQQPDGSYRMIIRAEQQRDIFKLATLNLLYISSITPLYPGIEELYS